MPDDLELLEALVVLGGARLDDRVRQLMGEIDQPVADVAIGHRERRVASVQADEELLHLRQHAQQAADLAALKGFGIHLVGNQHFDAVGELAHGLGELGDRLGAERLHEGRFTRHALLALAIEYTAEDQHQVVDLGDHAGEADTAVDREGGGTLRHDGARAPHGRSRQPPRLGLHGGSFALEAGAHQHPGQHVEAQKIGRDRPQVRVVGAVQLRLGRLEIGLGLLHEGLGHALQVAEHRALRRALHDPLRDDQVELREVDHGRAARLDRRAARNGRARHQQANEVGRHRAGQKPLGGGHGIRRLGPHVAAAAGPQAGGQGFDLLDRGPRGIDIQLALGAAGQHFGGLLDGGEGGRRLTGQPGELLGIETAAHVTCPSLGCFRTPLNDVMRSCSDSRITCVLDRSMQDFKAQRNAMSSRLEVKLKNQLPEIHRLAEAVDGFFEAQGLPIKLAYNFNLAFDEIITNIVSYGYDDEGERFIDVSLSLVDGLVEAEVIDDAKPHDPLQAKTPDITAAAEDRPIGGLGVFFIKTLMDKVEYRHENGRNHLYFCKRTSA
ncbi:MAG: ATP-binding protein [Alphaproteobacteria bacterium]|nr:ATP-binding protein [Alphaproteobacteria bacterium]